MADDLKCEFSRTGAGMSVRYGVYDLHTVATELAGKWTATVCIIRRDNMDMPVLSLTWDQEFATEAELVRSRSARLEK